MEPKKRGRKTKLQKEFEQQKIEREAEFLKQIEDGGFAWLNEEEESTVVNPDEVEFTK